MVPACTTGYSARRSVKEGVWLDGVSDACTEYLAKLRDLGRPFGPFPHLPRSFSSRTGPAHLAPERHLVGSGWQLGAAGLKDETPAPHYYGTCAVLPFVGLETGL
jgi:hypothetical protein